MGWLTVTIIRTSTLFRGNSLDRELREELRCHLELLTEQNLAAGMPYDEARRAAYWRLGNPEALRDDYFRAASFPGIDHFLLDLKLALADLRKVPGFCLAVILMLTAGLLVASVTIAIAPLLRKAPIYGPNGEDVFLLSYYPQEGLGDWNGFEASFVPNTGDYIRWRSRAQTLSEMSIASLLPRKMMAALPSGPASKTIPLSVSLVGSEFFHLLRAEPALGRLFDPSNLSQDWHSVVLSQNMWQTKFNSDSNVIGSTMTIEGKEFRVIGVMPKSFQFPTPPADLWMPQKSFSDESGFLQHGWLILARIVRGRSPNDVATELNAIGRDVKEGDFLTRVQSLPSVYDQITPLQFVLLLSAAGVVFAVACFNVSILVRARVIARRPEFWAQMALGASSARIVRQVLLQVSILVGAVGLLAMPFGFFATKIILWGMRLYLSSPYLHALNPGLRFYLFECVITSLLAILAALACGIGPALTVAHPRLFYGTTFITSWEKDPERVPFRSLSQVCQLAFALALFVGAGLMFKAFFLSWLDFSRQHDANTLLAANITLARTSAAITKPQLEFLYRGLEKELSSIPGVRSVTLANSLPFDGTPAAGYRIQVAGMPVQSGRNLAVIRDVTPGYFAQLSIPLLVGRLPTNADGDDALAVISASMARRFFGSQSPIGRRLRAHNSVEISGWITIVGVVGDIKSSPFSSGPEPTLYMSHQQGVRSATALLPQNIMLRTAEPGMQYEKIIVDRVNQFSPNFRVRSLRSIRQTYFESLNVPIALTWLLASYSLLALSLAAAGVYAVQRHWATQRRREIAIRVASGASRKQIVAMGLRSSVSVLLLGLAAGMPVAIATACLLRRFLWTPVDPWTFFFCSGVLAVLVIVASAVPLRSASMADPMAVLRCE